MAVEIVTSDYNTHPKDFLEENAKRIIVCALEEYDCEPWDVDLVRNIIKTLEKV